MIITSSLIKKFPKLQHTYFTKISYMLIIKERRNLLWAFINTFSVRLGFTAWDKSPLFAIQSSGILTCVNKSEARKPPHITSRVNGTVYLPRSPLHACPRTTNAGDCLAFLVPPIGHNDQIILSSSSMDSSLEAFSYNPTEIASCHY
jgi:hypothetical protein